MSTVNLVADLKVIQDFAKKYLETDWIDIRLRLFEGEYSLLWGDSQFDTDHRGYWASSSLYKEASEQDLQELITELLNTIEDQLIYA